MTDSVVPPVTALPGNLIEFRCPQCQKLLRIGSSAAGGQARCPNCTAVVMVPNVESNAAPTPAFAPATPPIPVAAKPPELPFHSMPPRNVDGPPAFSTPASPAAAMSPSAGPMNHVAASLQPAAIIPPAQPAGTTPAVAAGALLRPPASQTPTKALFDRIVAEIRKIYIGQDELVLGTLVALFSSGHVLIESVPGLGKTLFVRTLGRVLGCRFGRIQFTADLMPSDITGAPIFDMKTQEFRFHPGPVFTQFLLADEINRAPAKTHAALLEIMQEYRVTVERTSHKLDRPFLVMATQNPIESEGTYNLPEAQLDRFMFKIIADYPTTEEEANVLKMHSQQVDLDARLAQDLQTITSPQEINATTRACGEVRVDDRLIDYINKLVRRTRQWPQFHLGASPRAGIALVQGARTLAAFNGRDYSVPDDVVQIALPALRHRVILTAEADVEGLRVDDQLREMIRTVEVPRL
ncbi:MAG TPA: AAA family ATPase [Pirellulales bacterium]|nr:AAA family ATPase [Pirellulales bacterium]